MILLARDTFKQKVVDCFEPLTFEDGNVFVEFYMGLSPFRDAAKALVVNPHRKVEKMWAMSPSHEMERLSAINPIRKYKDSWKYSSIRVLVFNLGLLSFKQV